MALPMASHSSRDETAPLRSSLSLFASSSSANFAPRPSPLPTSVRLHGRSSPPSPSSSVRFSIDHRPAFPGCSTRSETKMQRNNAVASNHKRTCMCSPTSHPGSFRCAYHKSVGGDHHHRHHRQQQTASCHSLSGSKANLRRSAKKNSLVRIGGVDGKLVRRALTTPIRPSSHQQRRREAFEPRPSRLSLMSKAED